ncbi:MAG: rhomboid family intramembrane serine protease [Bacteroidetes bacterium]|nr:MAG: rhomboid family intramembrane serine protease [Bacteroidota bacterium]PIE87911.1 MAG: rhomboid family intramembrane serine protease [Bacteroidota bacterium]
MPTQPPWFIVWKAMRVPLFLLILMSTLFLADQMLALDLNRFGLIPLRVRGLPGIIMAPLLHGDLNHLWSNGVPFLVLGTGLFLLYKPLALRILFLSWFITGAWTWFFAYEGSIHVGSSGLVYALMAFHLTGALIRRRYDLTAFSLILIFFYGSMVWGFFPEFFPRQNISWESHLMGAITGIVLALIFRHEGPSDNIRSVAEASDEESDLPWDQYELEGKKRASLKQPDSPVRYVYKPNPKQEESSKQTDS